MPYWDWAATATPPAQVIEQQKVTIVTPKGRQEVVNPLFSYKFTQSTAGFPPGYNKWQATLRHPTSSGPDAVSDIRDLKE